MRRVALQGAAPHGLSVQSGQDEVAMRRRELRRRRRYAARGVVAAFEPGRELREVAFETVSGRGTVGLLHGEVDGVTVELVPIHTLLTPNRPANTIAGRIASSGYSIKILIRGCRRKTPRPRFPDSTPRPR